MAKFRINSGSLTYKGKTYNRGDVFDCELSLLERNIQGVPPRYTLVEGSADDPESGGTLTATNEDSLGDMTVKELKALATDEGIDLGEAKAKEEIVTVLRAALD